MPTANCNEGRMKRYCDQVNLDRTLHLEDREEWERMSLCAEMIEMAAKREANRPARAA